MQFLPTDVNEEPNIFIVKPYAETLASHKLFTLIVQNFIMTKVEVIDISTGANSPVNLDFLFRCRIYLRFEAL